MLLIILDYVSVNLIYVDEGSEGRLCHHHSILKVLITINYLLLSSNTRNFIFCILKTSPQAVVYLHLGVREQTWMIQQC